MARKRVLVPREGRRRRRRLRTWQKFLLATIIVAVGFGSFAVLRKIYRPIDLMWENRTEVRKMEDHLNAVQKENSELQTKRKYLQSAQGAETEARKLGFVRPGEISIIIGEDQKQKPN